jgi:hypothetical protein
MVVKTAPWIIVRRKRQRGSTRIRGEITDCSNLVSSPGMLIWWRLQEDAEKRKSALP